MYIERNTVSLYTKELTHELNSKFDILGRFKITFKHVFNSFLNNFFFNMIQILPVRCPDCHECVQN